MTMKQVPGHIEDALKLMITGSQESIQKQLQVYLKQIETSSKRSLEEAKKVLEYVHARPYRGSFALRAMHENGAPLPF